MIPTFPEFKKIALTDRMAIEQLTKQFPPYSDYNFISLWSWNTSDTIFVSQLNGNLVIRFTGYLTNRPFYSFLGTHGVNDTANELFALCIKDGLQPQLKLLPEISIRQIDRDRFCCDEDRDNFDYIYEVDALVKMEGNEFHEKRKHRRHFANTHLHQVLQLDLSAPIIKDEIVELCYEWAKEKIEQESDNYFHNELLAFLRYLIGGCDATHVAIGIYCKQRLVAISIYENVNEAYSICHFQKAIAAPFKGLTAFIVHETAKLLQTKGIKYMNWEQDLGIPGLRKSKESYRPCTFLKKFILSPKQI